MSVGEIVIAVFECWFGIVALVLFTVEKERWPGQYLRWTPYTIGGKEGSYHDEHSVIYVGIRRKGEMVRLHALEPLDQKFDEELYEAQSHARQRCIELNAGQRHIRRRLPK